MKRYDPRLWIGGLMILGGVLLVLENLHIISNVSSLFWGVIWGLVGLYFLYRLVTQQEWWTAFPAFTLLGLAGSLFLPESLHAFSGLVFFAGLAIAFLWVFFADPTRWWAIIPAGVMLTLGTISVLDELGNKDSGGMLFIGLGLTFFLVSLLPGGRSRTWALIPGAILLVFGVLLGTPFGGLTQYLWPVILIVLGGYFILRFFRKQPSA